MKFIIQTCIGDICEIIETSREESAEDYFEQNYSKDTCGQCFDTMFRMRELVEEEHSPEYLKEIKTRQI